MHEKGKRTDCFYLILQGKVLVRSGAENFSIKQGTFNHFGQEALLNRMYTPDYSAEITSYAKLLKISKKDYDDAIKE